MEYSCFLEAMLEVEILWQARHLYLRTTRSASSPWFIPYTYPCVGQPAPPHTVQKHFRFLFRIKWKISPNSFVISIAVQVCNNYISVVMMWGKVKVVSPLSHSGCVLSAALQEVIGALPQASVLIELLRMCA